jgi:uncharacterized membrane protein
MHYSSQIDMTPPVKLARLQSVSGAIGGCVQVTRRERIATRLILLCWCTVAIVVFVNNIGWRELWYDEIITAESSHLSSLDLIISRYWAGHSPLYFLILQAFLEVTGAPTAPWTIEAYLRLPSAIFAAGAGALLMHLLLHLRQRNGALVFGAMWLTWPLVLRYAQEARPYALVLLFTTLTIWGIVIFLSAEKGNRTNGKAGPFVNSMPEKLSLHASGLGSVGAALTMPLGILVAIAIEIAALLAFNVKSTPRQWINRCKVVWPILFVTALIFIPTVSRRANNYWTDKLDEHVLSLKNIGIVLNQIYAPALGIVYVIPIIGIIIYYLITKRSFIYNGIDKRVWIFLVAGAVLIPALLIAASLKASVLVLRYFTPALCFVLPAFALLMVNTGTFATRLLSAMMAGTILFGVMVSRPTETEKTYWQIRNLVEKADSRQPVFYTKDFMLLRVLKYYFQEFQPKLYFDPPKSFRATDGVQSGRPDTSSPFWVIQTISDFRNNAAAGWVNAEFQCSFVFPDAVATLVATDIQQLEPFEKCRKSAEAADPPP